MDKSLKLYKEIIDGIANLGKGVHRIWVKERGWPKLPKNEHINNYLKNLSDEEKDILVELLESARSGGIHDTLVYLNDRMAIDGLKFIENSVEMAHEPFDTTLYFDWVCRTEGDAWPDEKP